MRDKKYYIFQFITLEALWLLVNHPVSDLKHSSSQVVRPASLTPQELQFFIEEILKKVANFFLLLFSEKFSILTTDRRITQESQDHFLSAQLMTLWIGWIQPIYDVVNL